MRPVIGIPLRYQMLEDDRAILYMSERVRRTIQKAGGFVYPISPVQDLDNIHTKNGEFPELFIEEKKIINMSLEQCDGLMFPGGIKFTPYDRYLLEIAVEKKIPVLGICLGMQMMGCYGQDVNLYDINTDINHCQESDFGFSHKVIIDKNSKLYTIIGHEEILVNSFHKRCCGENCVYNVSARSLDGIIEAVEYPGECFNIGIQWHPEISYDFDENSRKLIDSFIEASRVRMKEKINKIEVI